MDEIMYFLVSGLRGLDGLTLLIVIGFFVLLAFLARPDRERRDAKRRNQAHKIR